MPATPSCETRRLRHPNSLRRQPCPRRPTALLQVHCTEARLLRPPHGSPVEVRVREVGAPARSLVRAGKIHPCHTGSLPDDLGEAALQTLFHLTLTQVVQPSR